MRLAILSDIHGNLAAFEAVLADLRQAGEIDQLWILGDLCSLGPRPAECLQLIRTLKGAKLVSGNTDRYLSGGSLGTRFAAKDEAEFDTLRPQMRQRFEMMDWTLSKLSFAEYEMLGKLRQGVEVKVPGYGYVIGYHGSPGNDEYNLLPDTPVEEVLDQFLDAEGRLGFGGHTHRPMDRDLGRWRVVNVGSVGFPYDEERACYVIANVEAGEAQLEFRRVSYDLASVEADLREREHPAADRIIEVLNQWRTQNANAPTPK